MSEFHTRSTCTIIVNLRPCCHTFRDEASLQHAGSGFFTSSSKPLQRRQGAINLISGSSTILSRGVEPLGPHMGVISRIDRGVRHLSAGSEVVDEEVIVVAINGHNYGRCEAGNAASSCGGANMKSSVNTMDLHNWSFEGVSPKWID
jgi:hypothetical protein